jgi:two-component sensor histidine kinase
VPCGLIVNELVSNALKHAFTNRDSGNIIIELKMDSENSVHLSVSDNGIGIPDGIDIQNSPSLGLQLVNALVNQIDGHLEYENRQGSRFTITFPNSPFSIPPME